MGEGGNNWRCVLDGKANSDWNGQAAHPETTTEQTKIQEFNLETSCQSSFGIRLSIQNTEI